MTRTSTKTAKDFFNATANENREGFNALVKTDMSQDFSWNVPAGRYMELFDRMLSW